MRYGNAKGCEEDSRSFPDFPIIATGGPTEDSIRRVIEAGANAVSYTAPSNGELLKGKWKIPQTCKGLAHKRAKQTVSFIAR